MTVEKRNVARSGTVSTLVSNAGSVKHGRTKQAETGCPMPERKRLRNALCIDRRQILAGVATLPFWASVARAEEKAIDIDAMLPGEFSWHPERSPSGPVAIIASLPEQRVHVYRNGVRIAVSTCSSGKPGHETPTGVFTVLQKDKHHHSSTYNNASMPNMNRLTWDGIALHAGKLPGYPASHGCLRLPLAFSEKLFAVTHLGTPVIVAGAATDPWDLIHPGLILTGQDQQIQSGAVHALERQKQPTDWTSAEEAPVTTVLITGADKMVTLLENGDEIVTGPLTVTGDPDLGEHVFMLTRQQADAGSLVWSGITHHPDPSRPLSPEEAVLTRLSIPEDVAAELRPRMHIGMTMIVSDLPASPDRRSGTDFVIMDADVLATPFPHERPVLLKQDG